MRRAVATDTDTIGVATPPRLLKRRTTKPAEKTSLGCVECCCHFEVPNCDSKPPFWGCNKRFSSSSQITAAESFHKQDENDLKREHARKFIEALLNLFKADVDAQVQKRTFGADEPGPHSEEDQYQDRDEGLCEEAGAGDW